MNKIKCKILIKKILKEFGLYSKDASELILMTIIHESSNFKYRRQLKTYTETFSDESDVGGFGLGQIELNTHASTYEHQLRYKKERLKKIIKYFNLKDYDNVIDYINNKEYKNNKKLLQYNDEYNILFIRLRYIPFPEKIPSDIEGKAKYWKKYYNTSIGKGKIEDFIYNYKKSK